MMTCLAERVPDETNRDRSDKNRERQTQARTAERSHTQDSRGRAVRTPAVGAPPRPVLAHWLVATVSLARPSEQDD